MLTLLLLQQLLQPVIINKPLPIRNKEIRDTSINYIVIHNDGGGDYSIARSTLIRRHLSYHYYIKRNGTIVKMLDPKYQADHVGYSFWNGKFRINKYSIGICFENSGKTPYTNEQYVSAVFLIQMLQERFKDSTSKVIVGHSDVALPHGRKIDPGKFFDWNKLQKR